MVIGKAYDLEILFVLYILSYEVSGYSVLEGEGMFLESRSKSDSCGLGHGKLKDIRDSHDLSTLLTLRASLCNSARA